MGMVTPSTIVVSMLTINNKSKYENRYTEEIHIKSFSSQITYTVFIGQTHLVFGKRVCTCVMKHSNAFRTFLNWLKNSKRVWHERKLHIMRVPLFANFDR